MYLQFWKSQWHPYAEWDKFREVAKLRKDHSWIYGPRLCPKDWWTSAITDKSSAEDKTNYDKWKMSNRMRLMVMKHSIPEIIRGVMPDKVNAKRFLAEEANWFTKSDKVKVNKHPSKLVNVRYNGKENIREYIM